MFNTIHSDLIRGHIDTIILKSLFQGDRYGYDICKEIEVRSSGQYQLKQPTLYSCLKRLETQGFITSYWGEKTNGGRRKYYTLSELGKNLFIKNQTEWEYSRTVIDQLISDRRFNLDALPPVNDNRQDNPEMKFNQDTAADKTISAFQAEALITKDKFDAPQTEQENLNFTNTGSPAPDLVAQYDILRDAAKTELFAEKSDLTNLNNSVVNKPDAILSNSYLDNLLKEPSEPVVLFSKEKAIDNKFDLLNSELFSKEFESIFQTADITRSEEISLNNFRNDMAEQQVLDVKDVKSEKPIDIVNNIEVNNQPQQKNLIEKKEQSIQVDNHSFSRAESYRAFNKQEKEITGREYKAVLNRLFRNKEDKATGAPVKDSEKIINQEIQAENSVIEPVADNIEKPEKNTSFNFTAVEKTEDPDFILRNDRETENVHQKFYDRNKNDFEEKTFNNENIFYNINQDEHSENSAHKEYRVKLHNKSINKDYSHQFYIYSNKMRFANFAIIALIMIIEVSILLGVFNAINLNSSSNTMLYVFSYLLPTALIALSGTLYKLQPSKKQRAQFNLVNNLIFYGLLFIMTVVLSVLINLVGNMTIFNYKEYLVSIVVPSVLATNFVVYALVYYALFKSKKFSV